MKMYKCTAYFPTWDKAQEIANTLEGKHDLRDRGQLDPLKVSIKPRIVSYTNGYTIQYDVIGGVSYPHPTIDT